MDGQELLIKFSATENWKKPYEAVKEFYEVVKPNQSIICEGSIKYSDKTASFNLYHLVSSGCVVDIITGASGKILVLAGTIISGSFFSATIILKEVPWDDV